MAHGRSVRTIISPTLPTATSQSLSSTSRTSTPGRTLPHVPRTCGLGSETIGDEISVMLKMVYTSSPKRWWNSWAPSLSGTMKHLRTLWSRSCGPGVAFSRNVAITPSRNTAVVCVSRTSGQNVSVEKRSGSTIDPPRASIAKLRPMPPMWNIGMLTRNRSEPSMKCQASGPGLVYMCRYDESTPFDGPVVPDV